MPLARRNNIGPLALTRDMSYLTPPPRRDVTMGYRYTFLNLEYTFSACFTYILPYFGSLVKSELGQ